MSISIGNYSFEGLFTNMPSLKNQSGVYAVLTRSSQANRWTVVDIGESEDVRSRVENHDRKASWKRNSKGTLGVAAYYCGAGVRERVEAELRNQYNPPCGDR